MTVIRDETKGKAFVVDDTAKGDRLDAYIAAQMPPHVSRSRVKDIVKQGGVSVNGVPCTSPNYRLKQNDMLNMVIPEPEEATPEPENNPLDIFFEDSHLLILNKPAGMVVHPAVGHWSGTLVNALLYHCGDSLSGIGGVRRPGIVHRLDKDTSGLLVVAKTEQTHNGLTKLFMDHGRTGSLKRAYTALVWGRPHSGSGTIDAPLARSSNNRKKRAVVKQGNPEAKHAVTHFKVLSELGKNPDETSLASLVECQLETGRTHQIRVHMSHIGHPLIGDQDYGKHFQTKENALPDETRKVVADFKRQALHAAVLAFDHPVTGKHLAFEAPLPDDFRRLISSFEYKNPGF
ncbi:MAG: RluA family pseudouridine synthase [Pseudomonadota bacterium]